MPADFAEAVINNLDEAIFLFNPDGLLIFVNKAGEEFFGRTLREVRARHYMDLFPDSRDITMLIQKTISEGRLFNYRDINMKPGRNIDIHLYPLYLDNNIEGVIVCIRENFLLMEKGGDYQFDSLLFMLVSIAHEIKNPLSGIKGAAQLMKQSKAAEDMREYIDLIIKETDRLDSVLHDYLQVSRQPVFNEINIHEAIEHALKIMEPAVIEKDVVILKFYDPSLPDIKGDGSKLLQVFINLIKNALESMDASAEDRKLIVSTRPASEYMVVYDSADSAALLTKGKKQRWIVINIEDTGKGISSGELEKIFLPFYTRKEGGSGIGLALSKKIIKDHGGIIKVKGGDGKGAIFSIYLPF